MGTRLRGCEASITCTTLTGSLKARRIPKYLTRNSESEERVAKLRRRLNLWDFEKIECFEWTLLLVWANYSRPYF
jgi:hypothetical protein